MKATEFCATLPEELQARCDAIVQGVRDGYSMPVEWSLLAIRDDKHKVTVHVYVMADALQIGEPDDSVRINVNHRTEQQIADILGMSMLTAKLADELHKKAAVVVKPCMHNPDANSYISVTDPNTGKTVKVSMSSTIAMQAHSSEVQTKLDAAGATAGVLCATVCKHWVNSVVLNKKDSKGNRIPHKAVNFGWHVTDAPYISPCGLHLWQPESDYHDWDHADYSQGVVLAHPMVMVYRDDTATCETMLFEDAIVDPVVAYALSYNGPLPFTRHPDVPAPAADQIVIAPLPGDPSRRENRTGCRDLADRRRQLWCAA